MKFNKLFKKYLKESESWEDSYIEIKTRPLKNLLLKNREYTSQYGFALFSEEDNLDVMVSKLPQSILTREGAKEFSLKLINELKPKPSKAIRGKLIDMVTSLSVYLEDESE